MNEDSLLDLQRWLEESSAYAQDRRKAYARGNPMYDFQDGRAHAFFAAAEYVRELNEREESHAVRS